jgi:hypothetical protein
MTLETRSLKRKDSANLTHLFNWLYKRYVRKIERVTVLDSREPSHKDEAIIECLKRFEVEIWDWEKIDLASEVICSSTKSLRELCLYSSGNQAVLTGWCAVGGFGDRKKFPKVSGLHTSGPHQLSKDM